MIAGDAFSELRAVSRLVVVATYTIPVGAICISV